MPDRPAACPETGTANHGIGSALAITRHGADVEHELAHMSAGFHHRMRFTRLLQRVGRMDMRGDGSGLYQRPNIMRDGLRDRGLLRDALRA